MTRPSELVNEDARALLLNLRELHPRIYEEQDTDLPEIVLATRICNRLPMENVWLIVVGPPSSGKTSALDLIADFPDVINCGSITIASLLSGSPARERSKTSTGGLLRQIGNQGILTLKDFSSVLSLRNEKQQEVMAALREIYDGRWTRSFGSDGGKSETWCGKVGIIAAATEAIDRHQQQMALMGERFLIFRIPVNREQSLRIAQRSLMNEATRMDDQDRLRKLVKGIDNLVKDPKEPVDFPQEVNDLLTSLSCFVSRGRTGIERNSYTREIESVPNPEEPARLCRQFKTLFCALLLIGNTPEEAWRKTRRIGLSSIPELRMKAIQALRGESLPLVTSSIARECNSPVTTTRRPLEDLSFLGITISYGSGKESEGWLLPDEVKEDLEGLDSELTDEEIPFLVSDLDDGEDSPEKRDKPPLFDPANKEGGIRVSPSRGDKCESVKQAEGVKQGESHRTASAYG
jgi:hypothetical protein